MFLCLLTLVLFLVPAFVQVTFKVELPSTLEIIVLLFIFSAEILGEISSFLCAVPVLGRHVAHVERIPGRRDRILAGGSASTAATG